MCESREKLARLFLSSERERERERRCAPAGSASFVGAQEIYFLKSDRLSAKRVLRGFGGGEFMV